MWVETGDWEGGHGYLVAGASTHVWEIDSIVAASKAISCLTIHSLYLHTHKQTALYLEKVMLALIAMVAHGKTGISSLFSITYWELYSLQYAKYSYDWYILIELLYS